MVIRKLILFLSICTVALTGTSCKKEATSCEKMGYEYTWSKPGIAVSPASDSLALGSSVMVEVAVPRQFTDPDSGKPVISDQPGIFGPLSVQKLTGNPIIPNEGALDVITMNAVTGYISTDTAKWNQAQLKISRTVHFDNVLDSFRLKITLTPREKGIFILSFGMIANRNTDCSLFRYFPTVKNTEKHLYMLTPLYGYTPVDDRVYCFKIY